MGRPSYRESIVKSGVQTVRQRGFASVGIREISAAAGVAQGSFTNHFATKEDFGLAVLNQYFEEYRAITASTVGDVTRRPLERLEAYFDAVIQFFASVGWRYGCLAGNMALEASEHSEVIRNRLVEAFPEWTQPFEQAIREAQAANEVEPSLAAGELAAALLEAWQGAILRMKVDRTPAALYRFKQLVFPALLSAPASQSKRIQTRSPKPS